MALTFVSSTPNSGNIQVPQNDYLKLVFNTEIQSSYLDDLNVGSYFQLYRKSDNVKIGVRAGRTATNNLEVYLLPLVTLDPNTDYTLIVVGGSHGIKNIANEVLASNTVITFKTVNFKDNQISIDITSGVVTFPTVTAEPTPPPPPTNVVSFKNVDYILEDESGTADFYYEDGSQVSDLYLEYSNPEGDTVGVKDLDRFLSYWNEDIRSRFAQEIYITKTKLPFDPDFFGNKRLARGPAVISANQLGFTLSETGQYVDGTWVTTNNEYIVKIPGAALSFLKDGARRNAETTIRFAGPLAPLYSTPDMVKALMSSNYSAADIDYIKDYDLYKKIHMISYELVHDLGFTPDFNDPKIFWVVRYVTCRTAYELLTGPFPFLEFVTQRSVLGQSVSFNKANRLQGDNGSLDNCVKKAIVELGLLNNSIVAARIGIKSVNSNYYPGHKRANEVTSILDLAGFERNVWFPDGIS
jgi:hypothetical protein